MFVKGDASINFGGVASRMMAMSTRRVPGLDQIGLITKAIEEGDMISSSFASVDGGTLMKVYKLAPLCGVLLLALAACGCRQAEGA